MNNRKKIDNHKTSAREVEDEEDEWCFQVARQQNYQILYIAYQLKVRTRIHGITGRMYMNIG